MTQPNKEHNKHRQRVQTIFHSVARHYDTMNNIMSLGMHWGWKKALIKEVLAFPFLGGKPPFYLLDVAGGSGDVARLFLQMTNHLGDRRHVTLLDPSCAMMAPIIVQKNVWKEHLDIVQSTAENLPFGKEHFHGCTLSFGLRNCTDQRATIKNIYDKLVYGGRLCCLEFNKHVRPFLWKFLASQYRETIIPSIGGWVTGQKSAYRYLADSIEAFPPPEVVCDWMRYAGFEPIKTTPLSGGVVMLTTAWKT